MAPLSFDRLVPDGSPVDVQALLESLDLDGLAPPDRPYTVANFIATADGSATFKGRSGPLGDEGDRALFHALREQVDAVVAGTTTLRVERYGRLIGNAERRERRAAAGRTPEPLACMLSASGRLPLEIPLFAEPEAKILVFSPTKPDLAGVSAEVDWERYDPTASHPLSQAMRTLRQRHGVRSLLCEGGPSLFGSFLHERLVDELFLTLAPKLAGGLSGPPVTRGAALPELAPLRIRWLLGRGDVLYLRYALA